VCHIFLASLKFQWRQHASEIKSIAPNACFNYYNLPVSGINIMSCWLCQYQINSTLPNTWGSETRRVGFRGDATIRSQRRLKQHPPFNVIQRHSTQQHNETQRWQTPRHEFLNNITRSPALATPRHVFLNTIARKSALATPQPRCEFLNSITRKSRLRDTNHLLVAPTAKTQYPPLPRAIACEKSASHPLRR
jgi:hypothetical protein